MTINRRLSASIVALAFAGLAAAGCSTHHIHHIAAKITCATQVASWYEKGGKADLKGLGEAVKAVGLADETLAKGKTYTATAVAPVVKATNSLSKAITTLSGNQPPGCVPGANADLNAGLGDFTKAVTSQDQFVKAVLAKNPTAAQKAGQAGSAAFKAGGVKFLAAVTALKQYLAG